MEINEKTIWNSKQNHPELIVEDCKKEFGLNEKQCDKLRFILMNRGVNKWLYARLKFIELKHKVKEILYKSDFKDSQLRKKFKKIYEEMQNIAKCPRWVEWGKHRHKNMRKNKEKIIIKGRHC